MAFRDAYGKFAPKPNGGLVAVAAKPEPPKKPSYSGDYNIPEMLPAGIRTVSVSQTPARRFYSYNENSTNVNYLLEVQPKLMKLYYPRPGDRYGGLHSVPVEVSLPWQYAIFAQTFIGKTSVEWWVHLLWAKKRIVSLDESLIGAKLTDVDVSSKARICLGDIWPTGHETIYQVLPKLNLFFQFQGGTNIHEGGLNLPVKYKTPQEWEEDSKNDSYSWMNWTDWETHKKVDLRVFFPKGSVIWGG